MAQPGWKLALIDWQATQAIYGYDSPDCLRSLSKIMVTCKECLTPYATSCIKLQPGYIPRCQSCRSKAMFASPEARAAMSQRSKAHRSTAEARAKQSEVSKRMWQDPTSRENLLTAFNRDDYKEALSARSKALWDDPNYRANMATVQTSDEYREHHRQKSLELWTDPEYASLVKAGMSSEEYLDGASERGKTLWADPEYRAKQQIVMNDPDYKAAQRARSLRLWSRQEYRERILNCRRLTDEEKVTVAAQSKLNWQSPEYREKMMAIKTDPVYREARSEQMKEVWKTPEYRKHMELLYNSDEYRTRMSDLGRARWSDQEYRDRLEATIREVWERDGYRSKMRELFDSDWFKGKIAQARAEQPRISSLQTRLYAKLAELGIPFLEEGPGTVVGAYIFDCLIPGNNDIRGDRKHLLIECQGDYWHTLPAKAASDRSKFTYISRYFPDYEIMYLWEREYCDMDRIANRILSKLRLNESNVQFSFKDINIREIDYEEGKTLIDAYHYIGKGRGGTTYGAYLGQELIACAIYSPPLRQNTAGQFGLEDRQLRELSRLCIHPDYQKHNFGSWFVSRTMKLLGPVAVVAYADATAGHTGAVYKAANFTLHHTVRPDYWYVDREGFVMHKRTLYGRAVKMGMLEREYAERHGYERRWGGEKLCFVRGIGGMGATMFAPGSRGG